MNYSNSWFKNSTIEELEIEREKVRQAYCSAGNDFNLACELQNLLFQFDEEISKKTTSNQQDYKYPPRREHGWYLPNDDE